MSSSGLFLFLAALLSQDRPAEKPSEKEIVALIDTLEGLVQGTNERRYMDDRYRAYFAPLPGTRRIHGGLVTLPPEIRDGPFARLVAAGVAALPPLAARLDDRRETKISFDYEPVGMGGLFFSDEYDRNLRTWKGKEEGGKKDPFDLDLGERGRVHTVTVGDLCFVAIGQIVNRSFNAVRYQPTGLIIVSSTSRSESLRRRAIREWGRLDEEGHRKSLEADALTADMEWRRQGALIRLSYYYPEAADDVALRVLQTPCYDSIVAEEFVRNTLYGEADASRWKGLLEDFVSKRTPAFRDGVLLQLLSDADWDPRIKPGKQAKPRLEALFPKATHPAYPDSMEHGELTRTIDALYWNRSSKVDDAVLALFRGLKGDGLFKDHSEDYLALACIRRLQRLEKYDAELAGYCRRRIPKAMDYYSSRLKEALYGIELHRIEKSR